MAGKNADIDSSQWTGEMSCKFSGTFERRPKPPPIDVPNGWFAVNFPHVEPKGRRHRVHGRWFRITSENGQVTRAIRFASANQLAWISKSGKRIPANEVIWIDWQAWIELNGRTGVSDQRLHLEFKEVGWWSAALGALRHPDPGVKISVYLGILSLTLGLLSLFLALVAMK